MTQCAFLLEVVVGELTLTTHHPPASPTICIKVGDGPPLLVPFLAQAFTSNLGQPETQNGRYVFQRGKSSIFSASSRLLGGGVGGRVRVEVLSCRGGNGGLPIVHGRCDAVMVPQDETQTRLGLRGKLALVGGRGEAAGHLSLSVSIKNLGEVVPTVGNWGLSGDKGRNKTAPGAATTYEESFDILQDGIDPSFHNTVPYHDLPPSEKIALKIASLEDPSDAFLGEWSPKHLEGGWDGLAQPPPILYAGLDREGARLWEEKMARLRESELVQTQEDHQEHTGGPEEGETSCTDPSSSSSQKTGSQGSHSASSRTHTPNKHHRHRRKGWNVHHPPKTPHRHTLKRPHPPLSIARPQGWLRSTPPASVSSFSPPRLNRSHLLRLAAANPQLGQNLKAEVERQVKDRVKGLEADFLEQVKKLAAQNKNQRVKHQAAPTTTVTNNHLESVGCQTEKTMHSQVPSERESSQGASLSPSSSSSYSSSHQHSHRPPKQTSTFSPKHPTCTSNKAVSTQTDTHRSTATSTPKEGKKTNKVEEVTEPGAEDSPRQAPPNDRIRLGQIPKNVTYVIGPNGERMYGEGIVVVQEDVEGKDEKGVGGGGRRGKERQDGLVGGDKAGGKDIGDGECSISSTSSKLKTRISNQGQSLGSELRARWLGQGSVPTREPSQDTWGLTYTIRAAEHDHSTASQEYSTPPTHLTTPQTDSGAGVGGGSGGDEPSKSSSVEEEVEEEEVEEALEEEEEEEVEEEVPSASSRSAQVCQEIFKGRKADILSGMVTSSPPQSIGESLLSPSRSIARSDQGHFGHNNSSPILNLSPSPRPSTSKQKKTSDSQGRNYLRKYYGHIYDQDPSQDSDSTGVKSSHPAYAQPSGSPTGPKERASISVDSSISDISARIAALLVAKRITVPRLNTESVSSYVPSEQLGTLSSVSDVIMSPSSSISG